MWQRFRRMVRSVVGFFISVAENPEIILEQNIRDMNDQVPRMNESIAMVKANVTLLEKEETKYKAEVTDLTAKTKPPFRRTGMTWPPCLRRNWSKRVRRWAGPA